MPQVFELNPLFLQTGDPEKEAVDTLHAPGTLGARMTVTQPPGPGTPGAENYRPKRYQIVKTDSTMAVSPFKGATAWWSDQANYVVTTAATNRGRVAGVFQNPATYPITKGQYCCIQIGGPGIVKFVDAPTAVPDATGLIVIPSATAGKADCLAAGTAETYPAIGRTAGAYDAANAEAVVDIAIPETV